MFFWHQARNFTCRKHIVHDNIYKKYMTEMSFDLEIMFN
jgi:hypothetical protein